MNCTEIQNLLLAADDLAAPSSIEHGAVEEHLVACEDCRQVAEELRQLEASWRALPIPAACDAAKSRFLARLAGEALVNKDLATRSPVEKPMPAEAAASERVRIRRQPAARW